MVNRKMSVFYKVVKENVKENGELETVLVGPLTGRVRKGRGRDTLIHTSSEGIVTELSPTSLVKLSKPTVTSIVTTTTV